MLKKEENELLTLVGPETPMGNVMRRYWIPALLSTDLPAPDGPQKRIRLLGEDLVAFRVTDGTVGVLGAHCPHRGTALFFGRNEENGLRCPYHGWKFDVSGRCMEMPNEPPESGYRNKVQQRAYPCVERGGLIWTYMGEAPVPPLPDFEWLGLPASHVHLSLRVQECNWLQSLEGELDSSHAPILHRRIDRGGHGPDTYAGMQDHHPRFDVVETDGGIQIGALRNAGDQIYCRVNHFLLPFWSVVPPGGDEGELNGHAWVPIDDATTLCVMYSYHPETPLSERRLKLFREGARGREPGHMTAGGALPSDPARPYADYWPKWNRTNDYGIDWEVQRKTYVLGVPGLWVQDAVCQETMGAVVDRSVEHLCAADVGITQMRRLLRRVATELRDRGEVHASVHDPQAYRVRSVGVLLPKNVPWREGVAPHVKAEGPIAYQIVAARTGVD